MQALESLPVAVVGAGPVGLAAAAHLESRGIPFLLFESGSTVGANVLSWKHIRIFSPWKYNIDKAARQLLDRSGWRSPSDEELPTGGELLDQYLRPLSELPAIKSNTFLNSRVLSIGRKNMDKMKTSGREKRPFAIQVLVEREVRQYEARAVIDASGTWNSPNPIGSGGVYAVGEIENRDRIFYGIPDILNEHADRYKNKSVLVVGSGHSSVNAILELNKLKNQYPRTEINWVLRKKSVRDVYGGQENDALAARGALGTSIETLVNTDRVDVYTPFEIQQIIAQEERLTVIGFQGDEIYALPPVDEIIANSGSRPDFSFIREVRLDIDHALESVTAIAELIDPNIHSCGTVRPHGEKELRHPEKDFYIAGAKSYGRAPTFLMATGYEQVRSIVAAIDGDFEAALNVELDLPETGVCSVDSGGGSCCGVSSKPKPETAEAACCG
ncbi:MAG TPA: NAD(P)-binding domain-containing protein [Chryseosolibacter sp.]|nr:NAD(P)-binding domain-containing protein [Chryseosolibacter sp.]